MAEQELEILEYRIDRVEKDVAEGLTEINTKLDMLIEARQEAATILAVEAQKHIQIESKVDTIQLDLNQTRTDVQSLQISTAERLGPGAIAGAVVAAMMLVLKFMVGI